ncbi:hypothetical protein VTL71DRAFT_6510 [Oculimacula yallundae]|uniref:Uncharacterized protein n=1 Tax=Oculimacula yallundae TaxID=86028 RepID=A0ABR4BX53_9HELO
MASQIQLSHGNSAGSTARRCKCAYMVNGCVAHTSLFFNRKDCNRPEPQKRPRYSTRKTENAREIQKKKSGHEKRYNESNDGASDRASLASFACFP